MRARKRVLPLLLTLIAAAGFVATSTAPASATTAFTIGIDCAGTLPKWPAPDNWGGVETACAGTADVIADDFVARDVPLTVTDIGYSGTTISGSGIGDFQIDVNDDGDFLDAVDLSGRMRWFRDLTAAKVNFKKVTGHGLDTGQGLSEGEVKTVGTFIFEPIEDFLFPPGGGDIDYRIKTGNVDEDDLNEVPGPQELLDQLPSAPDVSGLLDLVEVVPGSRRESEGCKLSGGDRVVDSTTQGVRTFVYVYQPSTTEVWLCVRVEDTSTGEGYGGRLELTPTEADPQVTGVPATPSTDGNSTACTTTTPNDVPTSHPISFGGVGPVDYMVDAYADNDEAWVCVQVGSQDHRVVVPLDDGGLSASAGTVATWKPDEGTPGA